MAKPDLATIPEFYHTYVNRVEEQNVTEALQNSLLKASELLQQIPEERWNFRYAEGKWSIKEMVQHIVDAERIFAYRALCIARGEGASLPGFDENSYAARSNADSRVKEELIQEWEVVRRATLLLFQSFDEEQLTRTGTANNKSINVLAIGFISAGHVLHHLHVLKERYLA